ncbi:MULTISPECIES: hypothetical protein [Serratia]|uniref:hypothetical protein n=1 Tax=Serratia TaxID=613 RepID=UPI001F2C1688|nr:MULTISPECIES: hypothetical protein [Serratia]
MGYWSFLDTGLVPCIIPGCFGRRRGKRTRFGGFFYVWVAGLSRLSGWSGRWSFLNLLGEKIAPARGAKDYTQQCLSGCGGREQRPEVTTTTFKSFAAYRPAGGTFLNNRCRVSALLMEISLTKGKLLVNENYLQKVKYLHRME